MSLGLGGVENIIYSGTIGEALGMKGEESIIMYVLYAGFFKLSLLLFYNDYL